MNLFDNLINQVLTSIPDYTSLRPVVEKELLQHNILQIMSEEGFLKKLVFIGGTCLRSCYGSQRLSEDLDFTGGLDFNKKDLSDLGKALVEGIKNKYGFKVEVSEPFKEEGNVDTWKLKIITRPESPHLPMQRINIDICALSSFDPKPATLLNHYGVDLGSSGLFLMAESREEIFADKIIALALRPNRIKNRDLWDILYLHRGRIKLNQNFIHEKLKERKVEKEDFKKLLHSRVNFLQANSAESYKNYSFEMARFLPKTELSTLSNNPMHWQYILQILNDHVVFS